MSQGKEIIKFSTYWNEERSFLTMFIKIMRYKYNIFIRTIIKSTDIRLWNYPKWLQGKLNCDYANDTRINSPSLWSKIIRDHVKSYIKTCDSWSRSVLTPMCWKSQDLITFVACLGRTPLLFFDEPSSWCKMPRSWFNCNWSCTYNFRRNKAVSTVIVVFSISMYE